MDTQTALATATLMTLVNGGITLGFTAYWLSLRQFYNDPPLRFMLLPP